MRIKLFNRDAQIVFSDDRTLIGRHAVHADNVRKALAGDSVAELETGVNHDGTGERTLEVYVPVHVIGSGRARGRARGLPAVRAGGGRRSARTR